MRKKIIILIISVIVLIAIIFLGRVDFPILNKKIIDFDNITKYEDNLTAEFFEVMATHEKSDNFIDKTWTVPDFTGWNCSEITLALKNINQPYRIEYYETPDMEYNAVINQFPVAGEMIQNDVTITLYVNSDTGCNFEYKDNPLVHNNIIECGEWLYYINNSCSSIKRSRIDMTESEDLYIAESGYLLDLLVNDTSVVFIEKSSENDNGILVKINIDGTGKQVLLDIGLSNLLFIDNEIAVLYNPLQGTMDFYNLNNNQFYSFESIYGYADRYALVSDQTKHFLGIRNLIYSLEKNRNFYDANGVFTVEEPYSNGERDESHSIYQHNIKTGDIKRLFDTVGRMEGIIETSDYWVEAESCSEGLHSKLNFHLGYIYVIKKDTEERKRIDFGIYSDNHLMNIAVWKNFIFNFSYDNNSFIYDIETQKKNKIVIPEEYRSFSYDSISVCGNYIYFELSNVLIDIRYNIILGEFELLQSNALE